MDDRHRRPRSRRQAGVLVEITGNRRDRVWMAGDVFDELDRLQERIGKRTRPTRC